MQKGQPRTQDRSQEGLDIFHHLRGKTGENCSTRYDDLAVYTQDMVNLEGTRKICLDKSSDARAETGSVNNVLQVNMG